jgi:hypothetical protein
MRRYRSHEQYGYSAVPQHQLGVPAKQQFAGIAPAMRSQNDQTTMLGDGLRNDDGRSVGFNRLMHEEGDLDTLPLSFQCCFGEQLLPVVSKALPVILEVSSRLEEQGFDIDHVQENEACFHRAGQP